MSQFETFDLESQDMEESDLEELVQVLQSLIPDSPRKSEQNV